MKIFKLKEIENKDYRQATISLRYKGSDNLQETKGDPCTMQCKHKIDKKNTILEKEILNGLSGKRLHFL